MTFFDGGGLGREQIVLVELSGINGSFNLDACIGPTIGPYYENRFCWLFLLATKIMCCSDLSIFLFLFLEFLKLSIFI